MTYPADVALANATDVYIRDLAYRTDAKLSSAVKYAVCPQVSLTANANGDVRVPFPDLASITGALVMIAGKASASSQWPAPGGGWTNNVILPVSLMPWGYVAGGVDTRAMIGVGYHGTAAVGDQGAKPVQSGTVVAVCGIAWGPA